MCSNEGMSTTRKDTRRPRLWRPGVVPIYRQHPITIALSCDRGGMPGSRARILASKLPGANHVTSFLAWLAVDSRKATQLYFASDSRRSFANGDHFDDCEKLFVASNSPDIFAMLGQDIAFPMEALPKICTLIDQGAIPHGLRASLHGRTDWVLEQLKQMKTDKPGGGNFSVFHGSRHSWGNYAVFGLSRHSYVACDDRWASEEYDLNKIESHAIECDGSGGVQVGRGIVNHTELLGSVSRAYFAGFVVALKEGQDKRSGGPPQLVGLGCVGDGRRYGLFTTAGTFFRGRRLTPGDVPSCTQWRDEGLEPVDQSGKSIRNRRRKVLR